MNTNLQQFNEGLYQTKISRTITRDICFILIKLRKNEKLSTKSRRVPIISFTEKYNKSDLKKISSIRSRNHEGLQKR